MSSKEHIFEFELPFGWRKEHVKCTFIENENADSITKEIIKNTFLEMEMMALQEYYSIIVTDRLIKLCKKLEEMFPEATFEFNRDSFDFGEFEIEATIKPYKNLTKKQLEIIEEITNTSLQYFENGQKAAFRFDNENFFDRKYNGASLDTVNEVALKHDIHPLEVVE